MKDITDIYHELQETDGVDINAVCEEIERELGNFGKLAQKYIEVIFNCGYSPENIDAGIDEVRLICEHGFSCGIGGFIYYSETEAFFDKNEELLLDFAEDYGRETGDNLFRFEYNYKNKIVWAVGEILMNDVYNQIDKILSYHLMSGE